MKHISYTDNSLENQAFSKVSLDSELERFRRYCSYLPKVVPEPVFVKVGANDGITGDPCSDILLAETRWKGLLIEPVPYCIDRLRANFQDSRRFSLEQVAIGAPAGEAAFYYVDSKARESIPNLPFWFDQLGSFNKGHIVQLLNGVLTPFIIECKVEVRPLADVLRKHGIRDVHLLHIDTEGHDYEVLRTVDFAGHAPVAIFVEHKHLPDTKKREMLQLLRLHGYSVHNCGGDYFALDKKADKRLQRQSKSIHHETLNQSAMSQLATQQLRVTIVMIARERHALTEATLEGLVANTPGPYRLIYTDGQTPEWLWQRLEQRSSEWGLELVRYDEPLWPQQLRNRVLDSITTDYVVFIDNDVQVSPNWLDKLVACADETNAGIVGPLYLWGDGQNKPKIHAYTSSLSRINTPQGTVMTESHALINAYPEAVSSQLVRKPCDFVEFHCMLLRTGVLKKMGGMDTSILNVHEHIDTALSMKQQGYTVYTEPAAQINYLAYAPYVLDDLPVHRWRWAKTPTDASIQAFCEKWQVLDHPLAFGGIRNYVHVNSTTVDPIRPAAMVWSGLNTPMQRHELRQTRSDLLDQATERGYAAQEIGQLSNAYHLAQSLTDGGYRPCGRPFINHLVGTASVLMRYGFKIEIVLAGMLHTLYSHDPNHANGVQAAADVVATLLGGKDSAVESRVRAYTRRGEKCEALLAIPASRLTVLDAEIIVMAVANQIDMRLSGEIRYSGRDDALPPEFDALAEHVCQALGVNGLAQTFDVCKTLPAVAPELLTKIPVSYRMLADKKHTVPMTNNLRALTNDFSGDSGHMRKDPATTSHLINAGVLEQSHRSVIILQEPLVILSTAHSQNARGMLGCAGLLPQLFVGRPSLHLISLYWSAIPRVSQIQEELRWAAVNLPLARFCYLASDEEELFALKEAGIDAFMGNLNIFIDERVFRPLPEGNEPARYDAVYDARFSPFKNHPLCSEIKKLALIYYSYPGMENNEAEVRKLLPHANYLNHERGQGNYQKLLPAEVNVILNQSSVGLCLSHVEGAMRASMQYLLAGTPVVTVPSTGGRERFFLPPYAQIVDADARNVARAVEKMKALKLPRAAVREYAATLVSFERRNFLQALNLRTQKMFGPAAKISDFSVFFKAAVHRPLKESLKALL